MKQEEKSLKLQKAEEQVRIANARLLRVSISDRKTLLVSLQRCATWFMLFAILPSRKLYLLISEKSISYTKPSRISCLMNADLFVFCDSSNFLLRMSSSSSFRYICIGFFLVRSYILRIPFCDIYDDVSDFHGLIEGDRGYAPTSTDTGIFAGVKNTVPQHLS